LKHWQETTRILDRVHGLARGRRACALAVVARIEGSAYRRAGAKLLVEDDGAVLGGVSGGCLEEDVRQVALEVMETGRPRALHYDTGADESRVWGLGLGCDGRVDILVLPIPPEAALGAWDGVRQALRGDSAFAVALGVEEEKAPRVLVTDATGCPLGASADEHPDLAAAAAAALRSGRSSFRATAAERVFVEILVPPPKLLVCGAGDDARALVALASGVGFQVYVADHRGGHLTAQRFPEARDLLLVRPEEWAGLPSDRDTFAVVQTHSLARDAEWVRRMAATEIAYVGVLGPRARTRRIIDGLPLAAAERIYGPVGLDLGADGPEQVALSVVAELLAVRSGREPRHLRERLEAVHAGP
jgi:xanthine/CO dehydrogenase XdhC/CoxF family maturation factor